MAKTVTCKKCGKTGLLWSQGYRWKLVSVDQTTGETRDHYCEGAELKVVACKFCNSNDLHWSKERMEDGSVRNVLCESYGLPHDCQERRDAKKAEWEQKSREKKECYAREKARLDALVAEGKVLQKQANLTLYRLRKSLWPRMFAKPQDRDPG